MKKVMAGIITAALVLTFAAAGAQAASHHAWAVERICTGLQLGRTCHGYGFTDSNGDGVCDNYDPEYCPGSGQGPSYGQGNGNGQGNGWHGGHGNGHGCHGWNR